MIRLKTLLEQTESTPTITGIEIMGNQLTPSGQTNVNVSGLINVINCESATGTYTVNDKRYDMKLVQQAIGTDTTIRVYAMNSGDTAATVVADSQPLKDLRIRFDFPKAKIPNLSDDTAFFVIALKAGKPIKYNNKVLRVQCEGFMLV